jgi:hypothetical protein
MVQRQHAGQKAEQSSLLAKEEEEGREGREKGEKR